VNLSDHEIACAILKLHKKFPRMVVDGLNTDHYNPEPVPVEVIIADVLKHRGQIPSCMLWLDVCEKRKTFFRGADTYTYKHEIETHIGLWFSHASLLTAVELSGVDMVSNPNRTWAGLLKLGSCRPGSMGISID